MGGAGYEQASAIAVDAWNNVYTTGLYGKYVQGVTDYTADFDPGPGVYNITPLEGAFVSKLIPNDSGLSTGTALGPRIGSFLESESSVTAGSNLTLTAFNLTLGTPAVSITAVTFYALDSSGTLHTLGTGTQNSDGSYSLTFPVNLSAGSYTLFAQASDSVGNLSDPLALTLNVL